MKSGKPLRLVRKQSGLPFGRKSSGKFAGSRIAPLPFAVVFTSLICVSTCHKAFRAVVFRKSSEPWAGRRLH